ncbi:bifunctional folylpolyglutamate synthase/dihydrofolate synthase [Paenibacillus antri]|uniref:Dihydrofolate synthase/folylpolyglutamate synthase n=1 Tax=Paenibacillus antri TaxID=2582848 RepID=A0A5R9GCQ2_9BACL|nr:folylpolyglutamate synthase/dihydrofolate synthase family protein [Paenibacillus antri]TLS53521.1 bifunctional folylpolyglutamate synthase/dihydrofolate synthase [Paenibacillus antri]
MFDSYEQALEWITKLMPLHGIKPGLERTEALLEKLGHPQRRLKFIHVAGTNGKGSTCAFLASALQSAGYEVGTFTSPYLEKYTNRIQVNGEDIPEASVLAIANRIKPLADELEPLHGALSMFELSTAIAIQYFATEAYPDLVVWETGMGGRLDSTNVVAPLASVITNVGLDHTDVLGETIPEIAREKAGIIKPGVPVISTAANEEAAAVVRETAAARKATLYEVGKQFRYETREVQEGRQTFDFEGPFRTLPNVAITMDGLHQQANAALALMTLEVLRQYYAIIVDDEDLYAAFARTAWKGRLEMVSREPRILLDGAHNPDGAKTLADTLRTVYTYRKIVFVLGMLRNKNHPEYLRHILPIVDTLIVTEPEFFKKMPAVELAEAAAAWRDASGAALSVTAEPDWKAALDRAAREAGPEDLIVVSGSLYFLSDARSRVLNLPNSEKGW